MPSWSPRAPLPCPSPQSVNTPAKRLPCASNAAKSKSGICERHVVMARSGIPPRASIRLMQLVTAWNTAYVPDVVPLQTPAGHSQSTNDPRSARTSQTRATPAGQSGIA